MRPSEADTEYDLEVKYLEVADTGFMVPFFSVLWNPWVRWPPEGRSMPIITSPHSQTALKTSKLAGEPE